MKFVDRNKGSRPRRSVVGGIGTNGIHGRLVEEQVAVPARVIGVVGILNGSTDGPPSIGQQSCVIPQMRSNHVKKIGLCGGILRLVTTLQIANHRMPSPLLRGVEHLGDAVHRGPRSGGVVERVVRVQAFRLDRIDFNGRSSDVDFGDLGPSGHRQPGNHIQ